MQLHIVGSSSQGNGYVLESSNSASIILEAGVKLMEIKKVLNFQIDKVLGCFITHEHGDHSKYVNEYLKAGIDVYMSEGTKEALSLNHHRLHTIKSMGKVIIKSFTIMAFDVKHDCTEPIGFLLRHPEMGTTIFATDTYYISYSFPGLNNILVECNYSKEILKANLEKGLPQVVKDRVLESHMELETCKEFLIANDLKDVHNIVLLHLSDGNSHAENFKKEVIGVTGKKTFIADKGISINLNKNPF